MATDGRHEDAINHTTKDSDNMTPHHMDNDAPDDSNSTGDNQNNGASAEAAGAARGLARSVGRSLMSSPIGRLPRRAVFRKQLPIRQVARVSDRISTGLDWWSSAVESIDEGAAGTKERSTLKKWIPRVKAFGSSLLKNMILGAAVFESYGYIVLKLAPDAEEKNKEPLTPMDRKLIDTTDDEKQEALDSGTQVDQIDEFARASLSAHFGAGSIAGSLHGVGSTFMESVGKTRQQMLRSLTPNMIHHSAAHSLLFGSYEGIKRLMLNQMHDIDDGTQINGGGYLLSFAVAGGLSGQVQYVASHYLEQWLGIVTTATVQENTSIRASLISKKMLATAPALRPALFAFVPSAIGFVAFEYGKNLN